MLQINQYLRPNVIPPITSPMAAPLPPTQLDRLQGQATRNVSSSCRHQAFDLKRGR